MSLFWYLEFGGDFQILGKYVDPVPVYTFRGPPTLRPPSRQLKYVHCENRLLLCRK